MVFYIFKPEVWMQNLGFFSLDSGDLHRATTQLHYRHIR